MSRRRGMLVTMLVVGLAPAAIGASSASASAGFGIEHYALTATEKEGASPSPDDQAGSRPYELTAKAVLEPNAHSTDADEVKDLDFELPPGLIVNPAGVPQNSVVGTVEASIAGKIVTAAVHNLARGPGEFALFAFTLEGFPVIAEISVRTGGDYGMTLSIHELPRSGIESVKLTLGGQSVSSFLTLPTSCAAPLQTTVQGESWGGEALSLSSSLPQLTGCNRLPFQPALSVVPDVAEADEPSGYGIDLEVPQSEDPAGLASAELKEAALTLPEGVDISIPSADGLQACSRAQFGLDSPTSATCPEASKVGQAVVETPLTTDRLEGAVYVATPNENPFGAPFAIYIVVEDPISGVRIKLAGRLEPNPVTGRLTIVLRELPQLPIGGLELHFFGGPRALLANPPTCGPATSTSELTPWSGNAPVLVSSSFDINAGVNGTPCSASQPFSPQLQAGSTTDEAGAYDSLTFVLSRGDQEQELGSVAIQTPQAAQEMFSGVPPCGEPQASAGTCPAASEIGIVDLAAGSGPIPYYLSGDVYLTGPYRGASQGLSIVVPFDAGPFELGTVVIRASVQSDPQTEQMTILGDPLPTILDGIPLRLKELALQLDRGEFQLNPDGCEPLTVTGTITSTQGSSVAIPTDPLGASSAQCTPPPATPSAPTSAVSGGSPHTAAVALLDTRIFVRSNGGGDGDATVELKCTGTSTCHGKLTLTIGARGSKRSGKRRGGHAKQVTTLATATYSIPPGKTTAVELVLDATARALLDADHGRLSATLTLLQSSPAPAQTHAEKIVLVRRKGQGKTK